MKETRWAGLVRESLVLTLRSLGLILGAVGGPGILSNLPLTTCVNWAVQSPGALASSWVKHTAEIMCHGKVRSRCMAVVRDSVAFIPLALSEQAPCLRGDKCQCMFTTVLCRFPSTMFLDIW